MRDAGGEREFAIEPLGETLLLLRFGDRVDAGLNTRVHAAAQKLRVARLAGVADLVPAYATLGLVYSPATWTSDGGPAWRNLADAACRVLAMATQPVAQAVAAIEIAVRYGGECGPDLAAVADHCRLAPADVIARHAAGRYRVAMLGFAPGFPYLLGLDAALHTPRRASPRVRVPRGSIAIGGVQTGIYPSELPGGWQLIGRTPLSLFDLARDPPCLLEPGDHVRFRAIDDDEFAALERTAAT
jgi:KipI family sensor histidine kinase inhibitor